MKYKRVADGVYEALEGRVSLTRHVESVSRGTKQGYRYHREICWEVRVDGKKVAFATEKLKDAKDAAERFLKSRELPDASSV